VKVRKTTIARENFKERLTGEFSPYTSVNKILDWSKGCLTEARILYYVHCHLCGIDMHCYKQSQGFYVESQ